jgi:hypothetical protein
MLNILPPVRWENWDSWEVFRMSERTSGTITAIFCRIGSKYFELEDSIFLKSPEILRLCQSATDGNR